jgi:hypothetical protein
LGCLQDGQAGIEPADDRAASHRFDCGEARFELADVAPRADAERKCHDAGDRKNHYHQHAEYD